MLQEEVIEPTTTEGARRGAFAPTKDDSHRFCVGYRKLNAVPIRHSYQLFTTDERIDSLGDLCIYSTLEASSRYGQVIIDKPDRKTPSLEGIMACINLLKRPDHLSKCGGRHTIVRKWHSAFVYLQDIFVFSRTIHGHQTHFEQLLTLLQNASVTLKLRNVSSSRRISSRLVSSYDRKGWQLRNQLQKRFANYWIVQPRRRCTPSWASATSSDGLYQTLRDLRHRSIRNYRRTNGSSFIN